jgi:hypothetical protein
MNENSFPAAFVLMFFVLVPAPDGVAQTAAKQGAEPEQPAGQHQQHRRGPKQIALTDSKGAVARLWKPDLTTLPLTVEHGSITLPRTGVDNYHAVIVEKDSGHLKKALIRYEYLRGKPSGHSTNELTAAEKTTLEIVPDPVPREHQHYRSDQIWNFILRFKGTPAAGIPVILETSHGTRVNAVSDSEGKVSLNIPDDFPNLTEGERDRRTAEFSISAEMKDTGILYQTLLSAEYRVNPGHWQSSGLGVAITGLGLLTGVFLGRIGLTETKRKTR